MSKKVYKTSRVQQLIDLNEDLTNFKLRFNLTSKNNEEFDMAIADQYTIDNSPEEIVFKKVKNTISGTIVSDKNVFQNHFLILKSSGENPAEVEVLINKQEISPNPESLQEQENNVGGGENREGDMREGVDMRDRVDMRGGGDMRERVDMRGGGDMRERVDIREGDMSMREEVDMRGDNNLENYENEKTTWIDIRLIIIILICILGGIFVYNIVTKKSGIKTSLIPPVAPSFPVASPSQNMNMNLINKLNSNIRLGL